MSERHEAPTGLVERQGSPWRGMWVIVAKDMADNLTSVRMVILELLILLTAGGTAYATLSSIRQAGSSGDFVFLSLVTTSQRPLPAFVGFLGFLVPLVAISLSFNAVNAEFNQRTMPRLLSQPIYRDAVLFGQFQAGLYTLALVLGSIWLLIIGLGVLGLGVPPTGQEVARMLIYLVLTIFYSGTWLAIGLLFSTRFRQPATAALSSIALWIFFTVFWSIIAGLLAQSIRPIRVGTFQEVLSQTTLAQSLARLSPNTLFIEATVGLLHPSTRSFGFVLPTQLEGALVGQPLPLMESLGLIWPHLTALVAATICIFALAYISFQRQEIRA
jgi:ABC-2 type transport system permease protein